LAGFVIGPPSSGRFAILNLCDVPLSWERLILTAGAVPFVCCSGGPRQLSSTYSQDPSPTSSAQPSCSSPERMAASDGNMLFRTALALLVAWLIGVLAIDTNHTR
jgi:hypothetical protein